ncbi:Type-1 restriction enzyme EcoKI specificity protein [Photobacterium malacitanum]|uniref:Type-1 restriction enzyme EcoKI specificity protein n=1 Tax=Photobacterium malacitanum TaxID=2204294 RepID=A0A1Y6MCB1_9GAMM|nr:restriction endonuclease subunit S [Photobacterium malacitanum]SMY34186.1 Type-1 restriction enzyme EcoKI specificity protein [Photobacterium malacitanum]
MTVESLITQHIDTWTSAVKTKSTSGRGSSKKLELYGVKKLRELILELAVRGKLVPQDPSDEPATVFLKKIADEKANLIAEKKLRKAKTSQVSDMPAVKISLPSGWALPWVEELVINSSDHIVDGPFGSKLKATEYVDSGVPIIRIQNIDRNVFKNNGLQFLSPEKADELERHSFHSGDIVLNKLGEPTGKACIIPSSLKYGIIVADIVRIRLDSDHIEKQYLTLAINSPIVAQQFAGLAKGVTRQRVNLSQIRSLCIPVPPKDEQHRIVAKVDELMTLCDQLEQQTEASIEAHQLLVSTLLNTLTNSADADELMENWACISDHFDTLFTTEESIDQLKQTILQLAVMGKLVPQDPNDEPASVLLERIAEEKTQLIKDKKIKKHPSVEPIGNVGVIPSSWKEIVVQDFADIRLGSTPSRHESKFWNGDIPWVSSGEVANGVIVDTAEKITQAGFDNSSTSIIPKRSLLMAIIGQGKTRGQTALLGVDACTNQNVAAFVFNEDFIIPEYVWLWAQSKYESHRQGGHGGAQPALNGKKVRSFAFPLPPTKEQKRIVEKADELNFLCNQLKARLNESQTTQLHLTDAIVEQAI